ncbi:MAG: 7-cyano-7-deazaguanine synthase [Verrucomicrobiaceae bacterium]|nr:7-cyano-7-deazaguanine synthase [Verrucomicrobiaceae bacterium]
MNQLFQIGRSLKPRQKPSGSISARPEFLFQFRADWTFSRLCTGSKGRVSAFEGQEFDADLEAISRFFQGPLSSLHVDLQWLALAVYLADRFAPRRPCGVNAAPCWRRSVRLSVPVVEKGRWIAAKAELESLLAFLTEDDWSIDFIEGRQRTNTETQDWMDCRAASARSGQVALFSGGLDSLAGLLNHLESSDTRWMLVSGQTHSRMRELQEKCVEKVSQRYPNRIAWLPVSYGMQMKLDSYAMEPTQRTRAFVHTALGAITAMMGGSNQLHLFENGIGSFNLPVDRSQLGSQTSRGTHPAFLNGMASLLSKLFDCDFRITNPYVFTTKAQMCSTVPVKLNSDLVELSFSCDRFPNYPKREDQCGVCSSCLLRRSALQAACVNDSADLYTTDITAHSRLSRNADEMAFFRTSSQGFEMNKCLSSPDPWNALCGLYPSLRSSVLAAAKHMSVNHEQAIAAIVGLYRAYWAEWDQFTQVRKAAHHLALAA